MSKCSSKRSCHSSYRCWVPPFTQPRRPQVPVPQTGTLTIFKISLGGVDIFDFNVFSQSDNSVRNVSITTTPTGIDSNGSGSITITVPAGIVVVTELQPDPQWFVLSPNPQTVEVFPNTETIVEFVNVISGTLNINKATDQSDGTFTFTITPEGDIPLVPFDVTITTTNGSGQALIPLPPGFYTIEEQPAMGWHPQGPFSSIEIVSGEVTNLGVLNQLDVDPILI